jgi:hypothetical protein
VETGIPAAAGCTIPANVISRSTGPISAGENQSPGKSLPLSRLASELEKEISKRGHAPEKTLTTRDQQIPCHLTRFAPFPSHRCGSEKTAEAKTRRHKICGLLSPCWSLADVFGSDTWPSFREERPPTPPDFYQRE